MDKKTNLESAVYFNGFEKRNCHINLKKNIRLGKNLNK
jgi:hypothetical protein